MEKKMVRKGRYIITYDNYSIQCYHKSLQFPILLFPFKWRGFIGCTVKEFTYGDSLLFFKNANWLNKNTLYLIQVIKSKENPIEKEIENGQENNSFSNDQYQAVNDDAEKIHLNNHTDIKFTVSAKKKSINFNEDTSYTSDVIQLRVGKRNINEIIKCLQKFSATELITEKVGLWGLKQQLLAFGEDWAFHVKPKLFFDSKIDFIPIHYMAFFLRTKSWHSFISGSSLYCGYHSQIFIKTISNSTVADFEKWCTKRAPRLKNNGQILKSSFWANPFNLWRIIHPDHISFTKEAVVYARKTFARKEFVYLPYKRTSLFYVSKGWFFRTIDIFGEQNIIPKFSFSIPTVRKIDKAIRPNGFRIMTGQTIHSSRFFVRNWFGNAPKIIVLNTRIIYFSKRMQKNIQLAGMHEKIASLDRTRIKESIWYKSCWSLFGTIVIKGTTNLIRKDQKEVGVVIILPQIVIFKYKYFFFFSGILRNIVKQSGAKLHRVYHSPSKIELIQEIHDTQNCQFS